MVGFPKPRPAALSKADRRTALVKRDTAENAKVKRRSAGRCEVEILYRGGGAVEYARCERRAVHVHHRRGGIGVRGVNDSALARYKVAVCPACHTAIHNHTLVPVGKRFRRVT